MNDDIIFEGYLWKQSLYLKSYRKRWVVLRRDNKLYSYKTVATISSIATEIIDLSWCIRITMSSKEFTLQFDHNNKDRKFYVSSKQELNQWIEHLRQAMANANNSAPFAMNDLNINATTDIVTGITLIKIPKEIFIFLIMIHFMIYSGQRICHLFTLSAKSTYQSHKE